MTIDSFVAQSFAYTYKELTLSGSNHLEYWAWEDTQQTFSRELLDNRFDFDLFYGDFLAGMRLRVLEPSRVDPYNPQEMSGEKIARRYLEYSREHFNIRVGNYYTTFGRGLTLRAYEDDLIRLDQDMDGVKIETTFEEGDLTLLTGQPRNTYFVQVFDQRHYEVTNDTSDVIRGIDFTVRPQAIFSHAGGFLTYAIGGNYVRVNHNLPWMDTTRVTELFGGNLNLTMEDLGFYGEYVKKTGWDEISYQMIEGKWDSLGWNELGRNNGLLLSLNYSKPGVGVTAQYGDYDSIAVGDNWNLNYSNRYNAPPAMNRFGLPINKGIDERGYEVSLNLSPLNLLAFELSHSRMKSRDTIPSDPLFQELTGEKKKITEFYGGGRWESFGEYIVSLSFDHLEQIGIFSSVFPEKIELTPLIETSYYIKPEHVVGFSYQHKILRGQYEFLMKDGSRNKESDEYTERQISLSYSYSPLLTFTLTREKRSREITEGEDTRWLLGELVFEITQNHRLTVRVGEEKGGVICSGGVCRVEPPFEGVKMGLLSRF